MTDQTKFADDVNKGITILWFSVGAMRLNFKEKLNRLPAIDNNKIPKIYFLRYKVITEENTCKRSYI